MSKEMQCRNCLDLLPDFEWLDAEHREQVEQHTAECDICRTKKEMILGSFAMSDEENSIIERIDFSDQIMAKVSQPAKTAANPFLFQLLGILVALEMIVICFSGFASIQEGFGLIDDSYQYLSEITFPVLDESIGIFEEVGYYSLSTEYLPDSLNIFFAAMFIVGSLLIISQKRSTYHESK